MWTRYRKKNAREIHAHLDPNRKASDLGLGLFCLCPIETIYYRSFSNRRPPVFFKRQHFHRHRAKNNYILQLLPLYQTVFRHQVLRVPLSKHGVPLPLERDKSPGETIATLSTCMQPVAGFLPVILKLLYFIH